MLAGGAAVCMIGVFGLVVAAMCGWFDPGKVTFGKGTVSIERTDETAVVLDVEIAKSTRQVERGLMYRKSLDEGKGMLFMFSKDTRTGFWMKNTNFNLDIAFIKHDGTIMEIIALKAHDTTSKRPAAEYRYALEVPVGYFAKVGIAVGDVATFPI